MSIVLNLSLSIAISSSNSITFSLKCVLQILILSVIVFWYNWHKRLLDTVSSKNNIKMFQRNI